MGVSSKCHWALAFLKKGNLTASRRSLAAPALTFVKGGSPTTQRELVFIFEWFVMYCWVAYLEPGEATNWK